MNLSLNAKRLRIVLFIAMALLLVGAVGGFILARSKLQSFASSISQMEADSTSIDGSIETYKQLQDKLKQSEDIKTKVNSITVPTTEYPVSVISNVTGIAKQAGVTINSINYGESSDTAKTTPQAPAGGAPTATPEATQTTPAGVTKKEVNVVLATPVDYDALMAFIKAIETDEMYMHINRITLTKSEGNTVTVQPLIIEVYTK